MGTPGVPWDVNKDEIAEALIKANGRVTNAAKLLNCHWDTLYRHINKYPELIQLLKDIRTTAKDHFIDRAEDKIMRLLDQEEDLANGLKAAMFVLNSIGRDRGWTNTFNVNATADASTNLKVSLDEVQEFAEWKAAKQASPRDSQALQALETVEIDITPQASQTPQDPSP